MCRERPTGLSECAESRDFFKSLLAIRRMDVNGRGFPVDNHVVDESDDAHADTVTIDARNVLEPTSP